MAVAHYEATRDARGVHLRVWHGSGGDYEVPERVVHHSPTGLEFGYEGSGPADLALTILADYFNVPPADVKAAMSRFGDASPEARRVVALYQGFKRRFVGPARGDRLEIEGDAIGEWVAEQDAEAHAWHDEREPSCPICALPVSPTRP